jgi:hypothetical protein
MAKHFVFSAISLTTSLLTANIIRTVSLFLWTVFELFFAKTVQSPPGKRNRECLP